MKETDWNRIWEDKIDKASWNGPRSIHRRNESISSMIAEQFHKDSLWRGKRNNQAGWIAEKLQLDKDFTLLDIGPGTGPLTVEMSRLAKSVTAIEPSKAMLSIFKRYIEEKEISNIKCMNKKWEDTIPFVDVHPHHVVTASFSLSMRNIQAALSKMHQLAKKYVCLFTFVGNPVWDYRALWPMLYGREYNVGPDYMDLYNVLYSIGIRANIEIRWTEHVQSFDSLDNALTFWKRNLNITSHEAERVVESYLKKQLTEKNGRWCSSHDMQNAMIWWAKEDP